MDEILNLIESVSEGFPSYFCVLACRVCKFDELRSGYAEVLPTVGGTKEDK